MKLHVPLLSAALLLGGAASASAAVLASETFNYADGSLVGQNGGTGWAAAWGTASNPTGSTTGTNNVIGGKLDLTPSPTAAAAIFRDFTNEFGTDGTTIWLTITMLRTGTKDAVGGAPNPPLTSTGPSFVRPLNFALFDKTSTTAQSERLSFGEGTRTSNDSDTFGLLIAGSATNAATVFTNTAIDTEHTALVRIDFGAGNADTAWVWMNPSFTTEPAVGTADATTTGNFTFDRVRPFAGNPNNQTINGVSTAVGGATGTIDNFIIGEFFSDVMPVPEPGSVSLALLALGSLLGRRRR